MSKYDHNSIVNWLAAWIKNRKPESSLTTSANLFSSSCLDSFDFIELIESIESYYGCNLDFSELATPQVRTIDGLADLILAKNAK